MSSRAIGLGHSLTRGMPTGKKHATPVKLTEEDKRMMHILHARGLGYRDISRKMFPRAVVSGTVVANHVG